MALPLTGITTTIVKRAIGLASNSVNALCNNYKINKWSKFKPVRYDNVAPNRGVGADWWRANDGNCGLSIPNYPTMSELFTALRAGTVMWDYLPPLGTAGQPCRLADFGGYEHSAQPFFVPMQLNSIYFSSLGIMGTALDLRVPGPNELSVSDLGNTYNLGSMYYGVAICKQGTTGYKYMTQNITMSSGGGGGIDVPISNELGNYEVVYFFAAAEKLSFSDPDKVNTFIPIPNAMQIVTIENSPILVLVSGTWISSTSNWEVVIENKSNMQIALTGCSLKIRYGDNTEFEPLEFGEASFTIPVGSDGTITVLPNSTQIVSGTRVNSLPDFNSRDGGLLYFRNNNTSYNAVGQFEM